MYASSPYYYKINDVSGGYFPLSSDFSERFDVKIVPPVMSCLHSVLCVELHLYILDTLSYVSPCDNGQRSSDFNIYSSMPAKPKDYDMILHHY